MIRCYRGKPQFRVERRQSNNANTVNTKTIDNKHFIHYRKRFLQTLSVCFVMPTSKHNYQCFLILVQSFSASTFSRIVDCFQYKLSSVWSYIFLFKWPRQKAKTKQQQHKTTYTTTRSRVFGDEPPSAKETFFGALSQGLCADWLVCIACCIFWHLIGSDQLSFFS